MALSDRSILDEGHDSTRFDEVQPRIDFKGHGPKVVEEAQVQVDLVLRTSDTLPKDTLSKPTDTGVRATAEARQTRKF
ncbi:hypothetical protein Syun_025606 [Stephania yunnanensis]|uniref:Uncharacterized protein n=1 Tax=Stephania yunnanensis TaxID=152371 RepID=A0AAP0ESP5_9MAGN